MFSYFKDNKNRLVTLVLVFLAIVPSCLAFYHWAFCGHDMLFHMVRIQGIADGIKSGQFPVRMNPTFLNGYGYPNSIMYGELFLYIPAMLFLCGFSIVKAYNTYIVIVNFATVFIAYYSFKRMFKSREIGLFSTAIYALAPYRFINIFVRSAVGEYTAMAFFPLIVYGLYKLYTDDKDKLGFLPLAIGVSGVIQSHTISVEMVALVMFVVLVVFAKRTIKIILELLKALGTIVLINLWFLVPFMQFLFTQDFLISNMQWGEVFYNSGANIIQLFMLFITYGEINGGPEDGVKGEIPFIPGFGMMLCLFICLGVLLYSKKEIQRKVKYSFIFSLLLSATTVWIGTLKFPWLKIFKYIPLAEKIFGIIQYSWRFFSLASLFVAVSAGFAIIVLNANENKIISRIVFLLVCILNIISILSYVPECINYQNQYYIESVSEIDTINATMTAEYLPVGADKYYISQNNNPYCSDNIHIENYLKNGLNITVDINENEGLDGEISLPLIWYNEYEISDSIGEIKKSDLCAGEYKQMILNVPNNYSGTISIFYKEPWYWRAAEIVSVLAIMSTCVYYIIVSRRNGKNAR